MPYTPPTNGQQNASWYPPKPHYTPSGNGEQNGSWYTGGNGAGGGTNPPSPPPATNAIYPLYGDAKGSSQFGRPFCLVS